MLKQKIQNVKNCDIKGFNLKQIIKKKKINPKKNCKIF